MNASTIIGVVIVWLIVLALLAGGWWAWGALGAIPLLVKVVIVWGGALLVVAGLIELLRWYILQNFVV